MDKNFYLLPQLQSKLKTRYSRILTEIPFEKLVSVKLCASNMFDLKLRTAVTN